MNSANQAENLDPAQQLLVLANESRAAAKVRPLAWDASLTDAAMKHGLRMISELQIAHRYDGELDLTTRGAAAGAHFSAIEENLAIGGSACLIHQGWLDSPRHRENLLDPTVDRVGIAVIAKGGLLFAVADYARAVPVLTQSEVEAIFEALLRARHLMISSEAIDARAYCAHSGKYEGADPPRLSILWQNSDVTQLPSELLEALANGSYHKAAVGSCPAQGANGAFTIYRVAVLLY